MDGLLKQTRVRFSDQEPQKDLSNRRLAPQKPFSFKEGKKKRNWLQRQSSESRMSHSDYSSDGEFETALAAAAYAVSSLPEDGSMKKKKPVEEWQRSASRSRSFKEEMTTKNKSHREEIGSKLTDTGRISRWFSGKDAKEDVHSAETEGKMTQSNTEKAPEKGTGNKPSIKKTPTFSDKYLNETGSKQWGNDKQKPKIPNVQVTKPTSTSTNSRKWKEDYTTESSKKMTKIDAWVQAELQKIKKKHENANATILEWENKKKEKAKSKLDKKVRELDLRKARYLQMYHNDISRIDKIAGGARALADETRRNDEAKWRKKANKIKSKGKARNTCFCF